MTQPINPEDFCTYVEMGGYKCSNLINKALGEQYCTMHLGIRLQDELWLIESAVKNVQKMVAKMQPRCNSCDKILTSDSIGDVCGECVNDNHDLIANMMESRNMQVVE